MTKQHTCGECVHCDKTLLWGDDDTHCPLYWCEPMNGYVFAKVEPESFYGCEAFKKEGENGTQA